MTETITQNLTEYHEQIKQHQRAIIALTGAIQALERLEKETQEAGSGDEPDSNQD